MTTAEIERNFTYHPPDNVQIAKYEVLREQTKQLAHMFNGVCPQSRELSLALTNLENAVFWANAAIARNATPVL